LILYLDTSAYVRLYIREEGHERIRTAARAATRLVTHLIAYAEMRATIAKMQRMQRLDAPAAISVRKAFELDWRSTLQIVPTEGLVRRAGELAERFALRGYDSVHLAAAESLTLAPGSNFLRFAAFDRVLNDSAEELGLTLLS
jgi:predicted nucleic acid-binding protein